jgi:hypothetical protein
MMFGKQNKTHAERDIETLKTSGVEGNGRDHLKLPKPTASGKEGLL